MSTHTLPTRPVNILILDIETTGLDAVYDDILEIAVIPAQLTPTSMTIDEESAFTTTIMPTRPGFNRMPPNVNKMHIESGLLEDINRTTTSILDAQLRILGIIDTMFGMGAAYLQLCGNSIHFDRQFIKQHMPRLEKRLSYRMMDMTPYRTIRNMISGVSEPTAKHRALADCRYSAGLLREFHEVLCMHITSSLPQK